MEQRSRRELDVVAALFALALSACAHSADPRRCTDLQGTRIKPSSLVRRVDVKAVDAHLVGGGLDEQWRAVRAKLQPGDQIWLYHQSTLGFQQGYVVIRNCSVENEIVTLIGDPGPAPR